MPLGAAALAAGAALLADAVAVVDEAVWVLLVVVAAVARGALVAADVVAAADADGLAALPVVLVAAPQAARRAAPAPVKSVAALIPKSRRRVTYGYMMQTPIMATLDPAWGSHRALSEAIHTSRGARIGAKVRSGAHPVVCGTLLSDGAVVKSGERTLNPIQLLVCPGLIRDGRAGGPDGTGTGTICRDRAVA